MRRIVEVLILIMIFMIFMSCNTDGDGVYLEKGSQGEVKNGKVTGLDSGSMYLVRIGLNWYPVKSDGTMGGKLAMLNYRELNSARSANELQALAAGVTEISGFPQDAFASVYKYGRPTFDWYLVSREISAQRIDRYVTWQKNMVIDLSGLGHAHFVTFYDDDVLDKDNVIIFVAADVINRPQEEVVTGSSVPDVLGGADWYYEFGSISASQSRPFYVNVSDHQGQKGFFTISGSQPSKLTKNLKRGSSNRGTAGGVPPSMPPYW